MCRWVGAIGTHRFEARQIQVWFAHFHLTASTDLLRQCAALVADHSARDRFEEVSILDRHVLGRAHENAAWPVDHVRFNTRRDQPHDLFLQQLPITAAILVPDHQIHHNSLESPVGVRLHKLANQIDIGEVTDLQQHDRQIAGNCIAPQARLCAPILYQDAGVRTQRRVGVDGRTGKSCIDLRVGFGGIDLAQHHLAMRPCQFKDAIRQPPILVFLDQVQSGIAGFADAGNHIDRCRLFRIECYPVADGDNRIQHRTLTPRECGAIAHGFRRSDGSPPANELHAVGLIRNLDNFRVVHGHQMKHP